MISRAARLCVVGTFLSLGLIGCERQEPAAPVVKEALTTQPAPPVPFTPTGKYRETQTVVEDVGSKGASGTASGDNAKLGLDGSAPTATLSGGVGGSGGSIRSSAVSAITDNQRQIALIVAGCIFLAVGAWRLKVLDKSGAVAGFVIGGCLIAAALMPAWVWALAGLAGLAAGGFWIYETHKGHSAAEGLRAVVAGVGDLPAEVQAVAKEKIKSHASDADRKTIRKVKFADNIP